MNQEAVTARNVRVVALAALLLGVGHTAWAALVEETIYFFDPFLVSIGVGLLAWATWKQRPAGAQTAVWVQLLLGLGAGVALVGLLVVAFVIALANS